MTAIVTGGAGFIGSHLVDRLAASERVLVIDDLRNHANVSRFAKDTPPTYIDGWPRRVEWWPHSVHDSVVTKWSTSVDVIYHLADPVGPVGVLKDGGRLAVDIIRDAHLAGIWAMWTGATLVYVSTSEVYGVHMGASDETAPHVYQASHSARREYAIAKDAAETMLLNTPDLDVRIVRPFNVAGPRQRVDGGFVLPRFIEQARSGEPLTVYTPGTQRRAFTHVLDIVDGLVRAAEQGYRGGVWNLGNPDNECDILTLAVEVLEVAGSSSAVSIVDPYDLWGPAFREAPDKLPHAGKAERELGWKPTRDRATTIRDALA